MATLTSGKSETLQAGNKGQKTFLPVDKHLPHYSSKLRERVAIFVDGANLRYACKALETKVDFEKLLNYTKGKGSLSGAYFYDAFKSSKEKQSWLRRLGPTYELISKPLLCRSDGSMKGNLDIEIALDLYQKALQGHYDTAVLISGDGDFACAVQRAKECGRRVEVIGLRSMTSNRLIHEANNYTDLSQISKRIAA